MEKQTKIPFLLLGSSVLSAIVHNLFYGITQIEEPVFFFLTLALSLAFFASILYNLYTYKRHGKPKDIWKLGFSGLFGLLGILPNIGPGIFWFYGFFAFFGLKK